MVLKRYMRSPQIMKVITRQLYDTISCRRSLQNQFSSKYWNKQKWNLIKKIKSRIYCQRIQDQVTYYKRFIGLPSMPKVLIAALTDFNILRHLDTHQNYKGNKSSFNCQCFQQWHKKNKWSLKASVYLFH